jgi:hypothetical protein
MTQDRYLGRRLTDRQTAEVLEGMFPADEEPEEDTEEWERRSDPEEDDEDPGKVSQ